MFSTQSQYGLPSNYQESYIYDENLLCSYAQDHLGAHPSGMGGWYAPACSFEASPWAWQWGEGIRTQEGPTTHYQYTAGISRPYLQPTCAVDQAPPAFSRAVGGPVFNNNRLEIICPKPVYPLSKGKWIDVIDWEDDEEMPGLTPDLKSNDDTDWEGEQWFDEDHDPESRFLPSFLFSPDPEDLPTPSFHPSSNSLASLSPDASDLPQPRFDSDPYSPPSVANPGSSVPGLDWSSRFDSFKSIVAPDPEDLPHPNFEIHERFEVGELRSPGPHDRHQDWLKRGIRDHAGPGLGEGLQEVVIGDGRKVLGAGRRRRRPDRARDK